MGGRTMAFGHIPGHRDDLDLEGFVQYLRDRGAEVLRPTNEWELVRYKAKWRGTTTEAVHIVYTKANGMLTFAQGSAGHYRAFTQRAELEVYQGPRKPPVFEVEGSVKPVSRAAKIREVLIKRDGEACWFCGVFMSKEDRTIEHLVPRSRGGANHVENYVLAHQECNRRAGNMSVREKRVLRDRIRAERAHLPPW